jgi:hypothetical protein
VPMSRRSTGSAVDQKVSPAIRDNLRHCSDLNKLDFSLPQTLDTKDCISNTPKASS